MNYFINNFSKTLLFFLLTFASFSQTKITGLISDAATGDALAGVNITIKGKVTGTTTNFNGTFTLYSNVELPFKLAISYVGYKTQEVSITKPQSEIKIGMLEQVTQSEEVVVAAARIEEKVMNSPVSIEKIDSRAIQVNPSFNFLESLKYLKGVDFSTQSITFTSINARGFNASGNNRLVQLVDGIDNQAPGLNFSIGTIGVSSDIDMESAEFLPGASSALYGPNAVNGILLMNTKSPFLYKGLSANLKTGITHEENRSRVNSPFYDFSIRWAQSFNDKLGVKINFSYMKAQNDWAATNYGDGNRNFLAGSSQQNNTAYNGVNNYGDQTVQDLRSVAEQMIGLNLLPVTALNFIPQGTFVTRTPYSESDLIAPEAKTIRGNVALHYRLTENIEAIGVFMYGTGTTAYLGNDRYSFNNFTGMQSKLELRGSNFFIRGYKTQENAGDSYATSLAGQLLNERWGGGSRIWYPTYLTSYLRALQSGVTGIAAHNVARGVADTNRPLSGTIAFNDALNGVKTLNVGDFSNPLYPFGGAHLQDNTSLYQFEGMYNFKNQVKFAEVIMGGNYRIFHLNSGGTFYPDRDGREISVKEWGSYLQISKSLLDGGLKVVASGRYDKNENFEGQFSPRLALVVSPWDNHHIRTSFQTGFRIPPVQSQYIDIKTNQVTLIGSLPEFITKYNLSSEGTNPAYSPANVAAFGEEVKTRATAAAPAIAVGLQTEAQTNPQAFAAKYGVAPTAANIATLVGTLATQQGVQTALTSGVLKPYQFKKFRPESVQSYEIGYRGLVGDRLFIDGSYFYSKYKNFAYSEILLQSTTNSPAGVLSANTRQVYQLPASSEGETITEGWSLGLDYRLGKGYLIGGNVSYNQLKQFDQNIIANGGRPEFNTPAYKFNASFSNRNVANTGVGFNVIFRYQDAFVWQSAFTAGFDANSTIVPAFSTLDAQISKKITSLKSILKVGGTNLVGKSYVTAFGNPSVGSMYYVSLTFDELLK